MARNFTAKSSIGAILESTLAELDATTVHVCRSIYSGWHAHVIGYRDGRQISAQSAEGCETFAEALAGAALAYSSLVAVSAAAWRKGSPVAEARLDRARWDRRANDVAPEVG